MEITKGKKRKAKKEVEEPEKKPIEEKEFEEEEEKEDETEEVEKEDELEEEKEEDELMVDKYGRKWKRCKELEEPTEEEQKMRAKAGIEQNPEESVSEGADAEHSTTSKPVIGVPAHTLMPPTQVSGDRLASGSEPSNTSYSGKSVNPDLLKSPLYQELIRLEKSMKVKLEAMEKSMSTRVANLTKSVQKFYDQPMYKAIAENVNPEGTEQRSISKQLEGGKIRFAE